MAIRKWRPDAVQDCVLSFRSLRGGLSLHTLRARRSGFLLLRPATSFNKGFIMSPSDESDVDIGQLPIILFGSQFAAVDDAEATGISASGPGCLQMLALRLMASGYPPEQSLSLYRNGQHIGKTTLSTCSQTIHITRGNPSDRGQLGRPRH